MTVELRSEQRLNWTESAGISLRHARPCAGHPRLRALEIFKDADARDIGEQKRAVLRTAVRGHDGVDACLIFPLIPEQAGMRCQSARLGAVAVQVGAVCVEPRLGASGIGINARDQAPEPARMIHLDEMSNLVRGEIIEHERRSQNQPP